jgi:hypothetical protein
MALWDDLVKSALIGTERQPKPVAADGKLGEVLARIPTSDPTTAFLSTAATVRLYDQAGRRPPVAPASTSHPAPADDLPTIGSRTAHFLKMMIGGSEHASVLPEALDKIAASGKRVPAEMLPSLLEMARNLTAIRPPLMKVLGGRGRWLAAQNPAWAMFATAPSESGGDIVSQAEADESVWQTGGKAARVALLRSLRMTRPIRARLLLENTWSSETADDRAEFLRLFTVGLSSDDEPLLESALDDRGREVRRTAAELLSQLPRSALVARMTQRAAALLAWSAGRKPHVEVTLPPEPDKAAQRDGVELKPFQDGIGQKQWWLFQTIAAVPPSHWATAWGQTPQAILAAAKGEWADLLHEAWLVAADRFRDTDWAEALWGLDVPRRFRAPTGPERTGLSALSPARQAELLAARIRSDPDAGKNDSPTLALLRTLAIPWTEDLGRAVLDLARAAAGNAKLQGNWTLKSALPEFAAKMPTSLLGEAGAGWPTDAKSWDQWKSAVDRMIATLHFRHDFLATL